MSTTTCAAVVWDVGEPFRLEDVELDEPRRDEVRVRMVAVGLCQSDMGAARGHFPFPLPGVLGHEGVGVVEAVGSDVTLTAVGDRVLLVYARCGHCRSCRGGHPAYCTTKVELNLVGGRRPDGSATIRHRGRELGAHFFGQSSFAHHAIVREDTLVVLPPDIPDDDLPTCAALACGVQAGAGAVLNVLRPRPEDVLAVAGVGGVGMAAVMATRLLRPRTVIAIDRVPARLALAAELGADVTVDLSRTDLAGALTEITGGAGVDVAIDATGHVPTLEALVGALAVRGRCGVVGVPPAGTRAAFDVMPLVMGRSVVGIGAGDTEPRTFLPALVEAVRRGDLPLARIQRRYPFAEINRAVEDAASGATVKPILVFPPLEVPS